jgi:hypothetical protein
MAAIVALIMGLSAFGWLTDPLAAAEGLGMPLLDGIGRSTQVGDFSAFFLGTTIFCVLGIVRQEAHWLYSAAIILGLAAVLRSLAWVAHGAPFATTFIVAEIFMTALLITGGLLMQRQAGASNEAP